MFSKKIKTTAAFAALVLSPSIALAHTGVGATSGIAHGFLHPMTGLDHLLAMVMVGLFAFQLGGRAIWLLPTTFVLLMAAAGVLGVTGIQLPFVETGIALSVLVLGAVVALKIRAPLAAALGMVGLFAIFHGHAHGAEMPDDVGGLAYAIGFMTATMSLHVAGIAAGFLLARGSGGSGSIVVRSAGAFAALAGIGLITGLI